MTLLADRKRNEAGAEQGSHDPGIETPIGSPARRRKRRQPGGGWYGWSIEARSIRFIEIERNVEGFTATGHDPRFIVDLDETHPPGWYLCDIALGLEPTTVSRFFVDIAGFSSGSGFVMRSVGGGVRRIVFRSPRRFKSIRIDPSEMPGPFELKDVRLVGLVASSVTGPTTVLSSGLEILVDPTRAMTVEADPDAVVHTPSPVPGTVIAARGLDVSGSAMRATSSRARLSIGLDQPLRRGWHSIVVRTEEASQAAIGVQFGFRGGLFNLSRIMLDRTAEGMFTTWVFLPARVGRLRLTVSDADSRFSITRVEAIATTEPWGSVRRRRTRSGILVVDQAAQEAARRPPWRTGGRIAAMEGIVSTPSGYRSSTYDANFRLTFDQPLRRGWYQVLTRVASDPTIRPRVHLDFGDGMSPPIRLGRDIPPQFSTYVRFPKPLKAMRFEPTDHPTAFVVDTLMLRRVRFSQVVRMAIASGYRHYRKDRKRFRRFLVDATMTLVDGKRMESFSGADALYVADKGGPDDYHRWQSVHDFDSHRHGEDLRSRIAAIGEGVRFSVLMPVAGGQPRALAVAIDCVRGQIWEDWELLIGLDEGAGDAVRQVCAEAVQADRRVRVLTVPAGAGISAAANAALAAASGSRVAVLGECDRLRPHALAEFAIALARDPGVEILYCDEDTLTEDGRRAEPHFKSGWSEDLFHAWNYLGRPVVLGTERVRAVGGFRRVVEAAQEYDLLLRIIERIAADRIRHLPLVLCHRLEQRRPETVEPTSAESLAASRRALEEHLERRRIAASVDLCDDFPAFRVRRALLGDIPAVTLVVPTRDRPDLLRPFLHTLFEVTDYPHFFLTLIDNGTIDPEALELIETYGRRPDVTVIRDEQPFNYSRLNNRAVALADTPLVALLNNDIRFSEAEWLRELASHAMRPEIGAVGAKLFYPDGRIQHAGVGLGVGTSGVAGHIHHMFHGASSGYFGRLATIQDYSAVTAAAIMMRRPVFHEVGGLDEENLTVAYNDIDLCLKIRRAGYRILWTPFARMFHYESASRGHDLTPEKRARYESEIAYMRETWGETLLNDPFYSPNFDRNRSDFVPAVG